MENETPPPMSAGAMVVICHHAAKRNLEELIRPAFMIEGLLPLSEEQSAIIYTAMAMTAGEIVGFVADSAGEGCDISDLAGLDAERFQKIMRRDAAPGQLRQITIKKDSIPH